MKAEIARFSLTGLINTTVGYTAIFLAMVLGMGPYVSNMIGYGVGFILGFSLNRGFVFRSQGNVTEQLIRHLFCFVAAYLGNIAVLHLLIKISVNIYICQLISAIVYVILMFTISRRWVFAK